MSHGIVFVRFRGRFCGRRPVHKIHHTATVWVVKLAEAEAARPRIVSTSEWEGDAFIHHARRPFTYPLRAWHSDVSNFQTAPHRGAEMLLTQGTRRALCVLFVMEGEGGTRG